MAEKIEKEKEGSSCGESSDEGSGSDSSSSSSGFALQKAKAKAKAKGKKNTGGAKGAKAKKEKDPIAEPEKSNSERPVPSLDMSAVDGTATPLSTARSNASEEGLPQIIEKAKTVVLQLQGLNNSDIVRQVVKPKEVDMKIAKAIEVLGKIEPFSADEAVGAICNSLKALADGLSHTQELLQKLQGGDSAVRQNTLTNGKQTIKEMLASLSTDDCLHFLSDIARRLVEAGQGEFSTSCDI